MTVTEQEGLEVSVWLAGTPLLKLPTFVMVIGVALSFPELLVVAVPVNPLDESVNAVFLMLLPQEAVAVALATQVFVLAMVTLAVAYPPWVGGDDGLKVTSRFELVVVAG